MSRYQSKQIPMSQIREQRLQTMAVRIAEEKLYRKKFANMVVETTEEYLARGGVITILRSRARFAVKEFISKMKKVVRVKVRRPLRKPSIPVIKNNRRKLHHTSPKNNRRKLRKPVNPH